MDDKLSKCGMSCKEADRAENLSGTSTTCGAFGRTSSPTGRLMGHYRVSSRVRCAGILLSFAACFAPARIYKRELNDCTADVGVALPCSRDLGGLE